MRATMGDGRLICVCLGVVGIGIGRSGRRWGSGGGARLADVVVVTSDNPRTENPDAIILREICHGFSDGWKRGGEDCGGGGSAKCDSAERLGRREGGARCEVLIAGKGHENYQIVGTTKSHFDDVEEAAAAMSALVGH